MCLQGRDSVDALEAQVVSRCTAAVSPASGILVVARARQLAFIDLAAAATAALAQSQSKAHSFLVAALTTVCCLTALGQAMHASCQLLQHCVLVSCCSFA